MNSGTTPTREPLGQCPGATRMGAVPGCHETGAVPGDYENGAVPGDHENGAKRPASQLLSFSASQLYSISACARTTWLEAIQQPVAFLMAFVSVAITLLVPVFEFHHFGEEGRLARDSGLSCLLLFGLVLAIGTAGRSVAGEIESGTAAAVIGKPVSRFTFVLAKWLGGFGVVAFYAVAQIAAILIAERSSAHFVAQGDYVGDITDWWGVALGIGGLLLSLAIGAFAHYYWRWRFGVTVFVSLAVSQLVAAAGTQLTNHWVAMDFRVVPVALLVLAALAVFSSLATALATRLKSGPTFALCFVVLLLGLAGDALFGNAPAFSWRGMLSGVLPDLQNFWMCDAIAHGGRIGWRYLVEAAATALTTCAVFLCLGGWLFSHRDLG